MTQHITLWQPPEFETSTKERTFALPTPGLSPFLPLSVDLLSLLSPFLPLPLFPLRAPPRLLSPFPPPGVFRFALPTPGLKFISPFLPPPSDRSSSSQETSFRASYPLIYDARFSQLMPYLDIAGDDFLGKRR